MKYNLTNIKPLLKIGISFSILVIVIMLITILLSSRNRQEPSEYTPSVPSPSIPEKIPQPASFRSELSKIAPSLPYNGVNYSIIYKDYISALEVEINAQDRDEYLSTKKQAESFITSKGITDICSLNIFWIPKIPQNKREEIQGTDVITTNCPAFKQ